MKGEHVDVVAPPCDLFSVDAENQASEIDDRPCGGVFTGNPFWIDEGERASCDGERELGVKNVLWGFAQIHAEMNGLSELLRVG